jgi:tetratricopeptide (TPR) repeat protein
MRSLGHMVVTILVAVPTLAQSPQFVPPSLKGDRSLAVPNSTAAPDDPASLYLDHHQAALAALKEANKIAALARSGDRAINLLLLSSKRDPSFSKPIYNLGVLCARAERLEEAISFYREAARVDPSPEMAKLTTDELERVQMLFSLGSTPNGRKRLQFDRAFMNALQNSKDTVIALDTLTKLIKSDPDRWEAPALAAVLQAQLGHYADSAKELESASHLAPESRRRQLLSAAGIANDEGKFEELVQDGDAKWEKQQYAPAAKSYSDAWDIIPGRIAIGMQSATGYLMADQIQAAVQILGRVKEIGPSEYSLKATKMLVELSGISEQAKEAASSDHSSGAAIAVSAVSVQIRDFVGDPSSSEMKLVVKTPPKLLEDDTSFIAIPDADLTRPETTYLSSESIFERYSNNKNSTLSGGVSDANPVVLPGQPMPDSTDATGPRGAH